MAIDAYGNYSATGIEQAKANTVKTYDENPKGILGKDDFLTLMLVQMQYQDPTEPMDAEKILSQTSELAGLEAATNTNKALEELKASLANSQDFSAQFSTIGAIGKMASLGGDAISLPESGGANFEMYFDDTVRTGMIDITDTNGNVVKQFDLHDTKNLEIVTVNGEEVVDGKVKGQDINEISNGTYGFRWDGTDKSNNPLDAGIYSINAVYSNPDGKVSETRVGTYPITSVKFDKGEAQAKLGSTYVPFSQIQEVYQ